MRIRNNGPAKRSYNSFRANSGALSKNLEKLSSGYKINRSADDAAGLAISEKMRAQITGLSGAQQNAKHGIGLIQVSEGALQEYHDILNRMLELSVESANSTYDNEVDRDQLQKEMTRLAQELNRIADATNFNGIFTLDGHPAPVDGDASLLGGETEAIYSHYHSLGLVDSDAKTGSDAVWTFGGYTCPPFDAAVYNTLAKQLDYFKDQYNANQKASTGWRAQIWHDKVNYMNPDGTKGGSEVKYCVCFVNDKTDKRRTAPPGLYGVYDQNSQGGSGSAQLQGNTEDKNNGALQTTGYVRLLIGETWRKSNFLDVPIFDMHADAIGLKGASVSEQDDAIKTIDKIKRAANNVSDARGTYGALQNRLEHAINYLGNANENIQSAESVIRDTDMADEMMKYTKNSILTQSAQSMLAQANMLPEGVLRLMQ